MADEHFIVGILLLSKDGVVLLKRADNVRFEPGKWSSPGGHIENGESAEDAAIRELQEETGIRASKTDLIDFGPRKRAIKEPNGNESVIHSQHFGIRLPDGFNLEKIRLSSESQDKRVMSFDELKRYGDNPKEFADTHDISASKFVHDNYDRIVAICKGAKKSKV